MLFFCVEVNLKGLLNAIKLQVDNWIHVQPWIMNNFPSCAIVSMNMGFSIKNSQGKLPLPQTRVKGLNPSPREEWRKQDLIPHPINEENIGTN
jgi:hypothetical protein